MIVHVRKWLLRLKFIIIFLLCTYLVMHLFGYIAVWIEPRSPYNEPRGHAVKVTGDAEHLVEAPSTLGERLKFFYWYGP